MSPTTKPPPPLNIPPSTSTVNVSIIDTTSRIKGIPFSQFMIPPYRGLDYMNCPAFSFLIENAPTGRKILFDLGVSKNWENGPKVIVGRIKNGGWDVTVEKDVADILRDGGVEPGVSRLLFGVRIATLFLHHHWDHTGDPSTFPPSTDLVVGHGVKSAFTPGYPTNPSAPILESAYKGRTLREISFADSNLMLGRCNAVDCFGDGSFYLLDTPGHAVGHMCGLCRTTTGPGEEPTFMFLGGDCAHHGGEIRPTAYLPLPDSIEPSPIPHIHKGVCPGALFSEIHRLRPGEGASTQPFTVANKDAAADVDAARESVVKLGEFDGHEDVLTMLAHDDTMLDVVEKFPNGLANDWKKKGWREKGMWRFLSDFAGAVEEKA